MTANRRACSTSTRPNAAHWLDRDSRQIRMSAAMIQSCQRFPKFQKALTGMHSRLAAPPGRVRGKPGGQPLRPGAILVSPLPEEWIWICSSSGSGDKSMEVRVATVYPGVPTMVDAMVAGTRVKAEWIGPRPAAGDVADVELGIDEVLKWGHSIAIDGQMTLREARGYVEPWRYRSKIS
jgi:hypothetical protein